MYTAHPLRYENGMQYNRCGQSGVLLPKVSLGFWHNFGGVDPYERSREITRYAFDHGITHFDLANNYGPPYGSAEETFGRLMDDDFRPYRDELFISTKAGYDMWPGPYGNWGSRKYLMASLDQSLKRMHLDYVDLFYSHRYDPETPLDETLQALVDVVRAGKALYVGISRWPLEATRTAFEYLRERDVPCLIYQGRLNLLDREPQKEGILDLEGKDAASRHAHRRTSRAAEGLECRGCVAWRNACRNGASLGSAARRHERTRRSKFDGTAARELEVCRIARLILSVSFAVGLAVIGVPDCFDSLVEQGYLVAFYAASQVVGYVFGLRL